MNDCIFCKIARKETAGDIVYEDETIIAFRDVNPAARVHILVIPKKHIEGVAALNDDKKLAARLLLASNKIAEREKIDETGFRVLVNQGADAGQIIGHLHFHLLGGERLKAV